MNRIQEIEQEQLHVLEYADKYVDNIIDIQKDNIRGKMLQLQEEKGKLIEYIK